MPNHVRNHIVCTGSSTDVAAFKELMVVPHEKPWENPNFDFNRLAPMPEILLKVRVPVSKGKHGRTLLSKEEPGNAFATREATKAEQAQIDKLASTDWYEWALENWGTKWNSYDFAEICDEARYDFVFDTAWSPPAPLLDTLTRRFPNLSFDVSWFDEGWCHAGDGIIGALAPYTSAEEIGCEPTAEIYEKVYGEPLEVEDFDVPLPEVIHRILDNMSCEDVDAASDKNGYFKLSATLYSDDPEFTDDALYDMRRHRDYIRSRISF